MENTTKKRGRPTKTTDVLESISDVPAAEKKEVDVVQQSISAKHEAVNVRSIRMTDATYDGLNEVKVALGDSSLEATLKQMINSFHLTEARKAFPERDTEIAQFEALSRKIIDSYVHSLLICNDAETRAKDAVKAQLESKDKTIISLQKEVQACKEESQMLRMQLTEVTKERDAAVNEAEALKMANRTDAEVSKRLADFQKQLDDALSAMKK